MENASKALIIAGGVLIGILILSLMTTLFVSSKQLSTTYDRTKSEEAIQQFNANFFKYVGRDLTIHEVVTICNFAKKSSNKVIDVKVTDSIFPTISEITYDNQHIKNIVANYTTAETSIQKYILTIKTYSDEGYINEICIKPK